MNFAEKTTKLLEIQGRSKAWLADKLGISKQMLQYKLNNNVFDYSEHATVKDALGIESIKEYWDVMEPKVGE
mgnify:CR=1 FL=1